jgi:hypothetical protein
MPLNDLNAILWQIRKVIAPQSANHSDPPFGCPVQSTAFKRKAKSGCIHDQTKRKPRSIPFP